MSDSQHTHDQVQRFVFEEGDIRGELVTLHQAYQDATATQELHPVARRLLGEFLAAVSLLSGTLKFNGVISLQARGDGPLSLIMAECTHQKEVRGIVRTGDTDLEPFREATFLELIGKGILAITIEPDQGERYQGLVPLEGDSLAACIEGYFAQSEQLPTRIWLGADTETCGGLLLQVLPARADADQGRDDLWETATHLAGTIGQDELLSTAHETLLYRLFHETPVRLFTPTPVRFACSCSRERSENALRSLGRQDVQELIAERDIITIDCQFCGQTYSFAETDVAAMFEEDAGKLH